MTPATLPQAIETTALDAHLALLFGQRLAHAGRLLDTACGAYFLEDSDANRDLLLTAASTYRGARADYDLSESLALATGGQS